MKPRLVPCACLWAVAVAAEAQTAAVTRLQAPIVLDGRIDDEAWQIAEPMPLAVYEPVYKGAASERTEIRVAYDERHLYVGALLYDSDPGGVRAGSLYRDRYAGDDTLGIVVDSFNDDRNARVFYTTPAGMRADGAVSDDMASGQIDWSWNGQWEARAAQDARGWSAEMRIPFATLGFRPKDGGLTVGLGVYRWLARHNERQSWPDVPPRWARAYAKPSKLVDVPLTGVRGGAALIVSPYLLGGSVDRATGPSRKTEAGVDLRRGIGTGFMLDLSVNTDFAQVEADDSQINLSRFPLFFPEKRPFFLEHADIFDFGWEGSSRLFHSRRVGLAGGEPVRLWGGVRLAGRSGAWDIGILDMQGASQAGLPAENFGVVRLRRRTPGGTAIGGMLTTRMGLDGSANVVAAADVDWRVTGDEFVTVKAARSMHDDGGGERLFARWQRRRRQGLSYEATLARAGRDFDAGLGFEARRDFGYGAGRVGYEWLLRGGGRLRRIAAEVSSEGFRRNADGRLDTAFVSSTVSLETRRGDELEVFATRRHEDVVQPFDLPKGLTIAAGVYDFQEAGLAWATSSGRKLRPGVVARHGSFYDGGRSAVTPSLSWNASRHFELAAEYERNSLRFSSRGLAADTHLLRLRAQMAWDIHASAAIFAQYNEAVRAWSVNGRARYHFREGTDLWFIYDDQGADAAGRGRRRSFLAKATYTVVR